MSQNPQRTIIQTAPKHYNQLRSVITEALIWLQITTDTGMKIKFETKVKERYQQLLYFITINVLKIEQQHPSGKDIIILPMTPIKNIYLNKHIMSLEIIHCRLLHSYDSVMKSMFRHQTLNGLPKHCRNKLNQPPCKICYTAKTTTLPKGTIVQTINLQPGQLIHTDFSFFNLTFICQLTSMLTVVCENTIIIWVLPTAYKKPVRIIRFILTTLKNKQHPCKRVTVYEDGTLENSTDDTNLLVDEFKTSMDNTDGDASWLNGNNEPHNIKIHNMVRSGLIYINQNENKWLYAADK